MDASAQTLQSVWVGALQRLTFEDVAQWAEANIFLSERLTNMPGPLQIWRTPYLAEPINEFGNPNVREITLALAAQTAKTTFIKTCLGYAIDQDPGPCLLVYPNTELARSVSDQRIQPLIDDSPKLARHKPADDDDYKKLEMHMDRMTIALAGSNSDANLMSRPIRYLFCDETEEYPPGAVDLALKRCRTFWNRKIIRTSTPKFTTGEIWTAFQRGDQRYYHVPCPHCGKKQKLIDRQLRWPAAAKGKDGFWDLERVEENTHYECSHCQGEILDAHKQVMLDNGEWIATKPKGRHASFQLSALYPTWVKFGEVASEFLAARNSKQLEKQRIYTNATLGEAWEQASSKTEVEQIAKHRGDYSSGFVPGPPLRLVCSVDVQKSELYYVIRAWSYCATSWAVMVGKLQGFASLDALLMRTYSGPNESTYRIRACWIDASDGNRWDEICRYCERRRRICSPVKGMHQYSRVEMVRKKALAQYGGIDLFEVDAGHVRDQFYDVRLALEPNTPGYWEIPADIAPEYLAALTSWKREEFTDKYGKRAFRWVSEKPDIEHFADCELMQEAAASFYGFANITAEAVTQMQQRVSHDPMAHVMNGPGGW